MNRLSNYFQSSKLAKLHISQALDFNQKKETAKAVDMMGAALLYTITAMNNVASIAFNHKPKEKRK